MSEDYILLSDLFLSRKETLLVIAERKAEGFKYLLHRGEVTLDKGDVQVRIQRWDESKYVVRTFG